MTRSSVVNAKYLRSHQTDAEQCLWYHLRAHRFQGFKFKRQKPIGPYIVDFVCLERQLVIELDGGQHANRCEYDERRDAWLQARGFRILRFWNNQVLNQLEGVLEVIATELQIPSPPAPLPQNGRGE